MSKVNKHKVLFTSVLFGLTMLALYIMFKDSYREILSELSQIDAIAVVEILTLSAVYVVIEGIIITTILRSDSITRRDGIRTAFNGCFYRGISFGIGTQIGQIIYLNKKGVTPGSAVSALTLNHFFHRISTSVYVFALYAFNYKFLKENYDSYLIYLNISFVIVMIVSIFLFLLCTSEKFHNIIMKILNKVLRGSRSNKILQNVNRELANIRGSSQLIFHKNLILKAMILNLIKLTCWYLIPYITLEKYVLSSKSVDFVDIISLSSLMNSIVGIIPTTGGMLSTELIFVLLFSKVFGATVAKSSMIIYRASTYVFPFILGALYYFFIKLKKLDAN